MAFLEDILGESILGSAGGALALGLGALVLVPRVLPAAARMARPLVKETIKLGLRGYDSTREIVGEASGAVRDSMAHGRAEAIAAPAAVAAHAPRRRERRKKARKKSS